MSAERVDQKTVNKHKMHIVERYCGYYIWYDEDMSLYIIRFGDKWSSTYFDTLQEAKNCIDYVTM